MPFDKFRGVTADRLDEVLASLTDDEFEEVDNLLTGLSQVLIDELAEPLGLDWSVDANALFCRLYRMSQDRTTGV